MTDREWLDSLKPGDLVIVSPRLEDGREATVDRVTSTLIIVGRSRYRRGNGSMIGGDSWNRVFLREPTAERRSEIRVVSLSAKLRNVRWTSLPLPVLEQVAKLAINEGSRP